jgi:hypothetical protein
VDQNGSCAGLLNIGERILYLNTTPIDVTDNVHAYLADTKPGQTLLITTNRQTSVVRLGGTEKGRLGIGIINLNRTVLFKEEMEFYQQDIPRSPGVDDVTAATLAITGASATIICLIVVLLLYHPRGNVSRLVDRFDAYIGSKQNALSHSLLLFTISFIGRAMLSVSHMFKFGFHSTNVLELWFYVDIANGHRHFLNPLNPTVYLLRLFGILSPEEIPFYSTMILGILLASTVPVIIYFLARDLHDSRTALFAGLIYSLLVQPIELSTVSFTQHLTQIPICLLFLFCLNRSISRRGASRLTYFTAAIIFAVLGYFVNVVIFIYAFLGYVAVSIAILRWLLRERGLDDERSFAVLMLAVTLLAVPLYLYFDDIASFSSSLTAKQKVEPSVNFVNEPKIQFVTSVPLAPIGYLRFYGPLLLFIPLGIIVSCRQKRILPYLLLIFGLLISMNWTRGSRILDIGVSLIAGLALAKWKATWNFTSLFIIAPMSLFIFSFLPLTPVHLIFLVTLGTILFGIVRYERIKFPFIALSSALIFSLVMCTTGLLLGNPQSTEAEYLALTALSDESTPGQRILTAMDRGHIPETITSLLSVSDEYSPRPGIAKAFFETEELAALNLAEDNVTYVMVVDTDLRLGPNQSTIATKGYVVYEYEMRSNEIPFLTVFRLTYPDKGLKHFRECISLTDRGTTARIFEVDQSSLEARDRPSIAKRITASMILRNPNNKRIEAWIPLQILKHDGSLYGLDSISLEMPPNSMISVGIDYQLTPRRDLEVRIMDDYIEMRDPAKASVAGFTRSGSPALFNFTYTDESGRRFSFLQPLTNRVSSFQHWIPLDDRFTPIENLSIQEADLGHVNGGLTEIVNSRLPKEVIVIYEGLD